MFLCPKCLVNNLRMGGRGGRHDYEICSCVLNSLVERAHLSSREARGAGSSAAWADWSFEGSPISQT